MRPCELTGGGGDCPTHGSETVPAADLYGGDHWSVAKTLPDVAEASGFDAHLWVASAGYGLVPADAPLRPYSATFAAGHSDSVLVSSTDSVVHSDFARSWWARLSEMPGPLRRVPRTIADIVRSDPRAYIVVVGSPDYMSAMEDDLLSAIVEASNPDRIIVVSTRGRFARGVLGHHLIPSDARLQSRVGGARTSLHVRVARKILAEVNEWEFSAELLRAHYRRVLASSADAPTFDRARLTISRSSASFMQHCAERQTHPARERFALFVTEDRPASSHGSRLFFTSVRKVLHAS